MYIDVIVIISARVCQRVELRVQQLAEEKSALELCLKQREADKEQQCANVQQKEKELKHALEMFSRYTHFHIGTVSTFVFYDFFFLHCFFCDEEKLLLA